MTALIKNAFLNNKTIKVISLILGYSLWSLIGNVYLQSAAHKVPVCFYNVPDNITIEAKPEMILVCLHGKRCDLSYCNDLAFHIDASALQPGEHKLAPTAEHLFLPDTINLIHYKPLVISLKVTKKI
jgi:hypothetical protein